MIATALQNYSNTINEIFGLNTSTLDTTKDIKNNVIRALNNTSNFKTFNVNFKKRLIRIKKIYCQYPEYLKEIVTKVNEIGSKNNWEGAFAELATYDYLNCDLLEDNSYLISPIKPNAIIDKSKTFASELGGKVADLDGYIEELNLYFDVKCFQDIVNNILEGIYTDVKEKFSGFNLHIIGEYELDMSFDKFKSNRQALIQELKENLEPNKTKNLYSHIISGLSYKVMWGSGIQTATRTYCSYRHAEKYHRQIFGYAKKFLKDSPNLIVMVVFPWFNNIINDFSNDNIKLYRSFARRVFCQYKHDKTPFNKIIPHFTGHQTIYEVTNQLSGIIFLEDDTITGNDPNKTNVKSYIYLNPNAKCPIKNTTKSFLMCLNNYDFDDFEFDNY